MRKVGWRGRCSQDYVGDPIVPIAYHARKVRRFENDCLPANEIDGIDEESAGVDVLHRAIAEDFF